MTEQSEAPGCRDAAIATGILLTTAIVFMAIGITLANQADCSGACETLALTLLYAGGPLSAALGVFFGDLWVAWPLEITLWVVVGFLLARWAGRRNRSVVPAALTLLLIALYLDRTPS